jgi:hypothetical protein
MMPVEVRESAGNYCAAEAIYPVGRFAGKDFQIVHAFKGRSLPYTLYGSHIRDPLIMDDGIELNFAPAAGTDTHRLSAASKRGGRWTER